MICKVNIRRKAQKQLVKISANDYKKVKLRLAYPNFEQQYRKMIFNVLARNHDDHVKNFSFLMGEDGTWKISPAYDLCFSYSPGGLWTREHHSSINGKFDHFTREDLLGFARTFGIKKASRIIEEVKDAVSSWPAIAAELDIPRVRISQIQKLLRLDI